MAELQIDPFVSVEPEVEVDEETLQLLDQRLAVTASLIPADQAGEQISTWLSNYNTDKPR